VGSNPAGSQQMCHSKNSSFCPPFFPPSLPPLPPQVDLPALTVKDKADLSFGVQNDIDFVAASFVRKAQDIHDIRAYLSQEMTKFWPATHLPPKIIAKIESTEAIQNYEEIMEAADGIMVARGDLGVRESREGRRREGGRQGCGSRRRPFRTARRSWRQRMGLWSREET